MAGRYEYLENHAPKLLRWAEKKWWHRVLLLAAVALLAANLYDLTKEFEPPELKPIFPATPAPTVDSKAPKAKNTPQESPDSLRRRTIRLANDLTVFWSQKSAPLQQPVQNPSTDEERQRNAKWDQYWRDVTAAYENAGFRDRIRGIVSEYKSKGIQTGYLEFADQYNRLVGSAPFGGTGQEDCLRSYTDLCTLRELAYHVDANDKPVILRLDSK